MKIVITGGTGLIGKRLVDDLTNNGHQAIVLSRSPEKYRALFPSGVALVRWDGRSVGSWADEIDGADAVVNLAGESISGSNFLPDRWTAEKKKRILNSRVQAGEALVAAIERAQTKPAVLIQSSAVGYYGKSGDQVIDETSPPGDDFLSSVTLAWENSTKAVEEMGVRRIVARIGLVLSTEDGALPRLILPARLFAGGWFGSGKQYWSWIHIADAAQALSFLIEEDSAAGVVNVTAPNPVRNKAFSEALGRALHRPSAVPVPGFALRLALGEVASTVLDGQRVLPKHLQELGFTFDYSTLDAALQDLLSKESGPTHKSKLIAA